MPHVPLDERLSQCPICKGTRVIRKEVDLSEAMRGIKHQQSFALISVPGLPKMKVTNIPERPRPPAGDIVKEGTRPDQQEGYIFIKGLTPITIRPKGAPVLFPAIMRGIKGVWRDIFKQRRPH